MLIARILAKLGALFAVALRPLVMTLIAINHIVGLLGALPRAVARHIGEEAYIGMANRFLRRPTMGDAIAGHAAPASRARANMPYAREASSGQQS